MKFVPSIRIWPKINREVFQKITEETPPTSNSKRSVKHDTVLFDETLRYNVITYIGGDAQTNLEKKARKHCLSAILDLPETYQNDASIFESSLLDRDRLIVSLTLESKKNLTSEKIRTYKKY